MKPTDTTPKGQTANVSFEVELKHPPAKVWRALTTPELLAEWLLPVADFNLKPGSVFAFQGPVMPGWDGKVNCRVLEADTHKRLRYSWVVGDMNTTVTFTLTPTGAGTHLSMMQEGFAPHQKQNFGGARYGWNLMGEKLIDLLDRTP